jgi:type I restriction enzyme M protein
MNNGNLNWIANFIWGIADDVLRDVYVRGKYRDVILPMVVIRRLDAVLEPTKQAVPMGASRSGWGTRSFQRPTAHLDCSALW